MNESNSIFDVLFNFFRFLKKLGRKDNAMVFVVCIPSIAPFPDTKKNILLPCWRVEEWMEDIDGWMLVEFV